MVNLALLLKCAGRNSQNLAQAEDLFLKVANLDTDLGSLPAQLAKARRSDPEDVPGTFYVVLDEIDDCLAYVKTVDSA